MEKDKIDLLVQVVKLQNKLILDKVNQWDPSAQKAVKEIETLLEEIDGNG